MTIKGFTISSLFEVRFVDRAGGCERPHTHLSLIISAVSKGNIRLQIDGVETCLEKGMIAAVGPKVLHSVQSYSSDFAGVYVLEIFSLPTNCEGFNESHFKIFGSQLFQKKESFDAFVILCRTLLSHATSSEKIKAYVDWVRCLFSDRFSGYQFKTQQNLEPSQLACKIRRILDGHNKETPPYCEIAKTCGCSKEHCNRIFKRAYNLSMKAYFLNEKAAKARDMLDSGETLSDVALLCGFFDQSHFTRVFKDIYQVSPKKYREALYGECHFHTRKNSTKHI